MKINIKTVLSLVLLFATIWYYKSSPSTLPKLYISFTSTKYILQVTMLQFYFTYIHRTAFVDIHPANAPMKLLFHNETVISHLL